MPTKTKRPTVVAPQNQAECNEFIRELGELQRQQEEINAQLNRQVAELTALATDEMQPLVAKEVALFDGIAAFASANRDMLTDGGKTKTFKLPAGECNWRMSPPAVSLTNVPAVMAAIKKLGLTNFIRNKPEIDREEMLKHPEQAQAIAGVKITQVELFAVKPHSVRAEITRDSIKKSSPKKKTKKSEDNGSSKKATTATLAKQKPR